MVVTLDGLDEDALVRILTEPKNALCRQYARLLELDGIQLTFEETAQILVSLLESPRIQAVCEYSEATETAEWTISYSGERLDVINNGDELALAVLKGITEEMKYNWNENAELPNQLSLKIQQA